MEESKFVEIEQPRKRILYFDRDYCNIECSNGSTIDMSHCEGYNTFVGLRNSLRKRFDLECMFNFDERALEMVDNSKSDKRFDALITHLPFETGKTDEVSIPPRMSYYFTIYGKSLDLIAKIKESDPNIGILVYTGMPPHVRDIPKYCGANHVIIKSENTNKDIRKINEFLDSFFQF